MSTILVTDGSGDLEIESLSTLTNEVQRITKEAYGLVEQSSCQGNRMHCMGQDMGIPCNSATRGACIKAVDQSKPIYVPLHN